MTLSNLGLWTSWSVYTLFRSKLSGAAGRLPCQAGAPPGYSYTSAAGGLAAPRPAFTQTHLCRLILPPWWLFFQCPSAGMIQGWLVQGGVQLPLPRPGWSLPGSSGGKQGARRGMPFACSVNGLCRGGFRYSYLNQQIIFCHSRRPNL